MVVGEQLQISPSLHRPRHSKTSTQKEMIRNNQGRTESEQEEFDRMLPSQNCGHCNEPFHPDNLEPLAGTKLCSDCALTYRETHAEELLNAMTLDFSKDQYLVVRVSLFDQIAAITNPKNNPSI